MSSTASTFYVGWDVGGWNCDRNRNSRDAIAILDFALSIQGRPWRGNLRSTINESSSTAEFIQGLFYLVDAEQAADTVILAIDTPLGFSRDFVRLVRGLDIVEPVTRSATNPYLYRKTERYLFEQGLKPLSAVKDMIGSQATKGRHVPTTGRMPVPL